jgi:molybdopterin-guanine dinucleotide biosynthesis protein A
MSHPPASIAVLAGGQSRRMGSDKALVTLEPGGPALLQVVLDRVGSLTDDLFVVSAPRPEYRQLGVELRPDLFPDAGPLGGIGSALRYARYERCLVLSCDHPFLNIELLESMIALDGDWDILCPTLPGPSRQGGGSIRQTLHAIYRATCLPAIERAIAARRLQIVAVFNELRVSEVDADDASRLDPTLRSFFSVNTPEALDLARRWNAEERPG